MTFLKIPDNYRYIISSVSGIMVSLFIVSIIFNISKAANEFDFDRGFVSENNSHDTFTDIVDIDSLTKYANIDIQVGATSLKVTSNGDDIGLVQADAKTIVINDNSSEDSLQNADISIGPNKESVFKENHSKKTSTVTTVKLNKLPIYNIDIKSGISNVDLDFKELKVKTLNLQSGATSIKLRFGDLVDTTWIKINSGFSRIAIQFPRESMAFVEAESALSANKLVNFKDLHNGKYEFRPDNFSGKVVMIEFEGALSSFQITNY